MTIIMNTACNWVIIVIICQGMGPDGQSVSGWQSVGQLQQWPNSPGVASWRWVTSLFSKQSNIFIILSGKDVKMEMRDHDHVVECVAWAPEAATQAINEAARDAAGGDNKNRWEN